MEQTRRFKAQPLPSNSPDCLPPRDNYPLTRPKPFTLRTDLRGEKYQDSLRERLKELNEREKENHFRAQPLPSFEPEIPKKPVVPPPTKPVEFFFLTDIRLEERKILDEQRKLRDMVNNALKEQKQREEMARQREEIRRLRSELVHRAQPIRHFTPIHIHPSNKRLTRAVSPLIGGKRRKYMQILEESFQLDGLQDLVTVTNTNLQDSVATTDIEDSIDVISSEMQKLITFDTSITDNSLHDQ
ncbi:25325_t:CDS:2 [Dentiscutata erythropus]|uniref:25325_t:CDS:1 n=1 Tax=Dentiscutata erythropus TaxID=1348616 RepID=A0A9N9ER13_9GLOM|nr:25325_t:CDS:2 [Dentiscutata erythropus]